MSFYQRYELLDLVKDGPVKTFAAREKPSGRSVSVHLLTGERSVHQELLAGIEKLPERFRSEIREQGDHEGTVYVVTDLWMREQTFGDWVKEAGSPPASGDRFAKAGNWRVPTAEFGKKSAPVPAPGEFTKMFRAGTPLRPVGGDAPTVFAATPAATPPIPEPAPEPPADPEPEKPEPGTPVVTQSTRPSVTMFGERRSSEFDETVEFAVPTLPPVKEEPARRDDAATLPYPAMPAPPPQPESPADEFSRMFGSAPPEQPPAAGPGEFTRMFQAGGIPPQPPAMPAAPVPPKPPAHPITEEPSSAGEFTKFFGAQPQPPSANPHPAYKDPFGTHQPVAPGSSPAGEFTRMFGAVRATPPAEPSEPPPPAEVQPTMGAYTRMFSATPAAPAVQPPPATHAATPPPVPQPAIQATPSTGGEFTRMLQTPVGPSALTTPAPTAPTTPQRRPRQDNTPLMIGLGILLVLAILLLVFFLLRK